MRRLLVIGVALLLSGLILASAADLDVSGGVLQVFHYEVDITAPTTSLPAEESTITVTTLVSESVTVETPVGP